MAHRFQNIDRNTPLLLPPDLRDWVAEDDLVHFIIQPVDRLPLGTFAVNHKVCGDEQYPPHMLLALLIYCYANGLFSSRRIERATYRDVAVHKSKREGYTQNYNYQAAVDADGSQLLVGQRVSDNPIDAGQLEPGLPRISGTLGQPTGVLADCGYAAEEVFPRLAQERPGLDLHVSVHREDAPAERRYDYRPPDKMGASKKIVAPCWWRWPRN